MQGDKSKRKPRPRDDKELAGRTLIQLAVQDSDELPGMVRGRANRSLYRGYGIPIPEGITKQEQK